MKSSTIKGVILCAGSGKRTGLAYNKILHYFGEKTCLEHCLDAFKAAGIDDIMLVISPRDETAIREIAPLIPVCYGGDTRFDSVKNALKSIDSCDIVIIHDGARPFVTPEVIKDSVEKALKYGSGIAAVPATDTVKTAYDGKISEHLKRENTFIIQTPQSFDFKLISQAYAEANGEFTDDSEVFGITGKEIFLSRGDYNNKKITRAEDLFSLPAGTFAGIGFDVHNTEQGKEIILGGIHIPCNLRLVGHSDADVLIHSIIDAFLSASALPDIGVLFPDTDDAYLHIDSTVLLKKTLALSKRKILSLSCVIIAQTPKLSPYIDQMKEKIAEIIDIRTDRVNISATTTEHLGIIGEGKAIAASSLCLTY